jgi:hypothetical protein
VLKIGGWEPLARSMLRVVVGFTFSLYGFQKLLGLFGGMGGRGATAPLFSLMWTAGVLETFGGLLICREHVRDHWCQSRALRINAARRSIRQTE